MMQRFVPNKKSRKVKSKPKGEIMSFVVSITEANENTIMEAIKQSIPSDNFKLISLTAKVEKIRS